LNRDPDVERAHVVVVERNGRQLLGAYLQPSVSGNFHPEEVKERLRAELPYYMIPNLWSGQNGSVRIRDSHGLQF
ncbi:hypothetical protein, partial [Bacteroides fragilis]|uniref:hypothetical protein n=1 Tax=Bacteroides fragilis TaxID=817 RepID=UPI0005CDFF9E